MFSDILLTVDYDRTLTAPDSSIPERNLEAIRYFIANGGAFTINTGRSIPMTRVFREKVPVNAPLLIYNGSAAYDLETEALCFCHEIQLPMWETLDRVRSLLPDLTVEIQGLDAHYRLVARDDAWDAFSDHNNCARGYARPGAEVGPFLKFALYGEIRDVTVASLYGGSREEIRRMDEAEALLNRELGEHCAVFRAADRIIDVHAKGVSKARSARELQARLGRKLLVCVGDAENDRNMLEEADFAYVPGDAILAKDFPNVCPCGQGAVAQVIYEKIPGILKNLG